MLGTLEFSEGRILVHHFLVFSTIDTYAKWKKIKKPTQERKAEQVYKVYLLQEESIRHLYQTRLNQQLANLETKRNVQDESINLKEVVKKAALETLGTKRKFRRRKDLRVWPDEIEKSINEKHKEYRTFLSNPTEKTKNPINRREIKQKR